MTPVGPDETNTGNERCPKWDDGRHNEIRVKGWLWWRLYAVCCSCGHRRRVR